LQTNQDRADTEIGALKLQLQRQTSELQQSQLQCATLSAEISQLKRTLNAAPTISVVDSSVEVRKLQEELKIERADLVRLQVIDFAYVLTLLL
jgi:hypothetical protein